MNLNILNTYKLAAFLFILSPAVAPALTETTVTLSVSFISPTLGLPVTLSATVTPANATGRVTFYDDVTILGTKVVTAGKATFSTALLPAGSHKLRAYYSGDSNNAGALSTVVAETIYASPAASLPVDILPWATTQIVIGDFNGDGLADLATANLGTMTTLLGNGNANFQPAATNPSLFGFPKAAADLNGDGKTDLIVQDQDVATGSLYVLLGNGDGTFQAAIRIGPATFVVIADFNGDGKPDLATSALNGVKILLGNGDGTFQPGVLYFSNYLPDGGTVLAVGDFNNDGKADLAAGNESTVSILLGNGDGTLQAPLIDSARTQASVILVTDLNHDGKADLVTLSIRNKFSVQLGNGDGTFHAPVMIYNAPQAVELALGDFNGDGNTDLAVGNDGVSSVSTISVLRGNGDGTFQVAVASEVNAPPFSLLASEFNGDGKTDLIARGTLMLGRTMTFMATRGTPQSTPVGTAFPVMLEVTLVDGATPVADTAVGFIVKPAANGAGATLPSIYATTDASGVARVTATANQTPGSYSVEAFSMGLRSTFLLTNDVAPYILSLLSGTQQSSSPGIAFPNALKVKLTDLAGSPVSGATINFTQPAGVRAIVLSSGTSVTDSFGVAKMTVTGGIHYGPDTVTASIGTQSVTFVLFNGFVSSVSLVVASANPAVFGSPVTLTATVSPGNAGSWVTFYDGVNVLGSKPLTGGTASFRTGLLAAGTHQLRAIYRGDGTYAAATSNLASQTVNVIAGGAFVTQSPVSLTSSGANAALGDFNGDGKVDLAFPTFANGTGALTVALGKGDGTFMAPVNYSVGAPINVGPLATGDFNADGYADLAVTTYIYSGAELINKVAILSGNGDGTFRPAAYYDAGTAEPPSLTVVDFDRDGKADLLLGNNSNGESIMFGIGDGTFRAPVPYAAYVGVNAVADFNGDGKADLALANPNVLSVASPYVVPGNGDGTAQPPIGFSFGQNVFVGRLIPGDFNRDGKSDLAVGAYVAAPYTALTLIVPGNGDGTFQPAVAYSLGTAAVSGDFNGDGYTDLVVTNTAGKAVGILQGKGDGTFQTGPSFSAGYPFAVADFNGDGRADLLTTDFNGSVTVLLGATSASMRLTATAGTPQSTTVGAAFPVALQVTLKDENGLPVPNVAITFTAPTVGAGAYLSNGSAVTNAAGVASVVATANGTSGTYAASASTGSSSVSFQLTNTPGAPATINAVAGSPQSSPVGRAFPVALNAAVKDSIGNPVSGVTVTFTVPVSGAGATLSSTTAVTNASGVASVTATANTIAGTYTVKASIGNFLANFTLTNTAGIAATIAPFAGTPQFAGINRGFAVPLQVIVKDAGGTPINGATVTFAAPTSGASAFFSSNTATTNASGIASVTAGANSFTGSYTVTASTGILSTSFSLNNVLNTGDSNLALGKATAQSSTLTGSSGPGAAVDGNTDGGFYNGSVTHTNTDTNPWWQVDLGAPANISSIVIWNRTDCCSDRLSDYWVFISNSPFLPTDTLASLQNRADISLAIHQTGAPNPFSNVGPANMFGQYVRVQLTGTNNLSLAEVQVNGTFTGPVPTDLALGKTATQSSTLSGYSSAVAGSAVDGVTDGNFFDNSVTHTNADQNAWWQVDLGASAAVGSVVVWGRMDACCVSRMSDYWVFVSDTPFQATDTPATLQGRANTFSSHQSGAPDPSTTITVGGPGRYVRVQLAGTNNLSLAEVLVYGTSVAAANIAVGKTATQSSTLAGYSSAVPGSAIDGNTNGNFFSGSVTHTNADANAWWQVDLGASAAVNSVVVWNRTDCCGTRMGDYWVFISDTPFQATDTPATLQGRAGTVGYHQTSAPSPATTITTNAQGRYVRVQLSGTDNLSLAEVQIFGSGGAATPPRNDLAIGKAVSQSSTLAGTAAGAANDGNIDGNFYHNSVTHTNPGANAWWQVDLGVSTAVNSVVVWNRTDCCGTRLGDYWVFVSDVPFLSTDTPATLMNRVGTFASHQSSAPNPSTSVPVVYQGRYVRIQLSGTTDPLSLAEVQVFGQ